MGGLYTVKTGDSLISCAARGLFRLKEITPLVGDNVEIEIDETDNTGFITIIYDRKTELIRPRVANVTKVVITFSVSKPRINLDLLDRFLIVAEIAGVTPVICINKMDLKADAGFAAKLENAYKSAGYDVIFASSKTKTGLEELKSSLHGHISVFAGPSGVGKTSLINDLLGGTSHKTGDISKKTERGKHTTRHAELMCLDEGSYIVDTPGFTSLDLNMEGEGLDAYFPEFSPYVSQCFFNDCFHETEDDCAVKAQVGKTIDEGRYNAYLRLLRESRSKYDE